MATASTCWEYRSSTSTHGQDLVRGEETHSVHPRSRRNSVVRPQWNTEERRRGTQDIPLCTRFSFAGVVPPSHHAIHFRFNDCTVLLVIYFFYRVTQKIQFYQLRFSDVFPKGDNFYAEILMPILSFIKSFYSLTDSFIAVFHYISLCLCVHYFSHCITAIIS